MRAAPAPPAIIMDVMLMLEAGSLTAVYSDFKATADAEGRGLTLHEFVRSFLRHVPPHRYQRDALALTKQLIELFDVIDVNGDAAMEWSEFVSFCIEAGMAAVKREPKAAFSLRHDARLQLDARDAATGGGGGGGFTHAAFVADLNALVVSRAAPCTASCCASCRRAWRRCVCWTRRPPSAPTSAAWTCPS